MEDIRPYIKFKNQNKKKYKMLDFKSFIKQTGNLQSRPKIEDLDVHVCLTNLHKIIYLNIPNFDDECFTYLTGNTPTDFDSKTLLCNNDHYPLNEDRIFKVKQYHHDHMLREDTVNVTKSQKDEQRKKYTNELQHNIQLFITHLDVYKNHLYHLKVSPIQMIKQEYPLEIEWINTHMDNDSYIKLQNWWFFDNGTRKIDIEKRINKVNQFIQKNIMINQDLKSYYKFKFINREFKLWTIDCEMIECTDGNKKFDVVGRISVLDSNKNVFLDQYIDQEHLNVTDWRTKWSGISLSLMTQKRNENCVIKQNELITLLQQHISSHDLLLGHDLHNDLSTLKIIHYCNLDTSVFFSKTNKLKLRDLTKDILFKTIQDGNLGHNSVIDCQCTFELCMLQVMKQLNLFDYSQSQSKYIHNQMPLIHPTFYEDLEINRIFHVDNRHQFINELDSIFNQELVNEKQIQINQIDQLLLQGNQHENINLDDQFKYRNKFIDKVRKQIEYVNQKFPGSIIIIFNTYFDMQIESQLNSQMINNSYNNFKTKNTAKNQFSKVQIINNSKKYLE